MIISKPYTFSPNAVIKSSEHNANYDTIYNAFNGNIDQSNLADGAVVTSKVQDSAITADKLASNAVTTAKINDGSVTTAKLADDAVTPAKFTNPYKFNVYRSGAQNVGTAATKVQFNAETFDTNGNFDSTTNYRYVAPVDGYYQFDATISTTTAGSGTSVLALLYVNGSLARNGVRVEASAGEAPIVMVSGLLYLTASQYVEVYVTTGAAAKALDVSSAASCCFSGFLVSET